MPILQAHGINTSMEYAEKVVELTKERASFVSDLLEQTAFFFQAPAEYDPAVIKKRWKEETPNHLNKIIEIIETTAFEKQVLHDAVIEGYITANQLNMGQIMNCFRLCLVGAAKGPDLFEIIMLLGKDETLTRIRKGIETIKM